MRRRDGIRFGAVLAATLVLAPVAHAGQAAAREIEGLIAELGRSDCQFERNGRWHDAAAAEQHLRRKYEWLRKRDLAGSAEQFIERAGTRSSITGRAYQVRCPGTKAVASAHWLRDRLQALRRRDGNAP